VEKEYITHEPGNPEAWVCICGNQPHQDGFYPVNFLGQWCEPVAGPWDTEAYGCARCGRIIDQNDLEVVGQMKESERVKELV